MSRFQGFIGPWYATTGYGADSQRTINYYPEAVESGEGKNSVILRGTPGLSEWCELPTSPVRGLLSCGAPLTGAPRLFAVGGSQLYEISSGGVATPKGSVGTDAGNTPVQMELNGLQLFVVSAGQSYVHNGATLISAGMPTATTGCFIDGYGIVQKPASRNFKISALEDFSTWAADPVDLQAKGGYPDHIGSTLADHQNLWLFGESASEVWNHNGNPDFPFERVQSIHQGIAATWSATRLMNGVAWLGQDTRGKLVAWWAQGSTVKRVSNYAVENRWESGTVSDAISFTQVVNGHHFWWITFPTLSLTLVYDATNGWWHQRAYWNGASIERHRARCHAFAYDKHLVGDHTNGKIYEMSDSYGNDDGTEIHRIRQAPHISDEEQRLFHHELRLDFITQTSVNPTMYLTYSKDNGATWSTEVGLAGASGFKHERSWRRLGSGRDRIYSIRTVVDSCPTLINAFLDVTKGID